MMTDARLQSICATHVRNFKELQLTFHPQFNLILGDNASGKTSLLEAIYLLGTARSFRATKTRDFVQNGYHFATVFGEIFNGAFVHRAAIKKTTAGDNKILLNDKMQKSIAALAKLLPMQMIGPDLELLSDAESGVRRQFLDWGLFYEQETYWALWKKSRQILHHRNALLKQERPDENQLDYWDGVWVEISNEISGLRQEYLDRLTSSNAFKTADFLKIEDFVVEYQRGWPNKKSLAESLIDAREKDLFKRYTQYGIHRDDIKILVKNRSASQILSRGQKKLMTLQLKFAQADVLFEKTQQKSIFLLDDLASELDEAYQKKVIQAIIHLNYQAIITSTHRKPQWEHLIEASGCQFKMFHVKHGVIEEGAQLAETHENAAFPEDFLI